MYFNMPHIIQVVRSGILEFPGAILILCSKIKISQGAAMWKCILGVLTNIAVLRHQRRTKQMYLNTPHIIQVVRSGILEFPGAILILCSKIKISQGAAMWKCILGVLTNIAVLRHQRRTKQMYLNTPHIIQVIRRKILEFPGASLIYFKSMFKIKISQGAAMWKLILGV